MGKYVCPLHPGCSDPHTLVCTEPTLTQQHFAEECDINEILKRANATGLVPINGREALYGDFTEIPTDLLSSMAVIKRANTLFMAMPWEVRERFQNDPAKMVQFLQDPANRDEAIKLGLVKAPEVVPPPPSGGQAASPPAGGPAV